MSATDEHSVKQAVAATTSIGAAVLLLAAGVLSIFQGISALDKDDILVSGPNYTYEFSAAGWGWIHLVLGILIVIAAVGLIAGAMWARVIAVFLAALSILANFLWLPYYPWWSTVVIALDVVVIWAVTTWRPGRI
ncbi:hypothetical protein [Nocardia implantans]|uniref:DUF7144 domain-containing protein n=1 Tax=Nocardia implantans TaxID=3108168 RepID=A0ABU6AXT4_9NOCA|nr:MULTISPECIES: hypothetical protein [unclassified Nocardia]MBF6193888.1 hypothetical protein [Nocardia beijingensis]MEA3529373.1 hypothetical protein [Nocardia sp. CDC192]MEB3511959.1 hypothetical protein [Nocardia sp. CDC186]